jgi:hypothetical protein
LTYSDACPTPSTLCGTGAVAGTCDTVSGNFRLALQDKPFVVSSISYTAAKGGGGAVTLCGCVTTQTDTGSMSPPWNVFVAADQFFSFTCAVQEQPPGLDLNVKISAILANGKANPYSTTSAVHTQ